VLESDPIADRIRIQFIDTEYLFRTVGRIGHWLRGGTGLSWTTATAAAWPACIAFERMVYRRFGGQLRAHSFDLIHRLSRWGAR
jgi:hypothetical protein